MILPREDNGLPRISRRLRIALAAAIIGISNFAAAAPPRVASDSYKLEQVAAEPQITTPIGLAFDSKGRLLVVESHTHLRGETSPGPDTDRIRMLADTDGDGKLDTWSTFAEGFNQAMNLLPRSDGAVYVVTRHGVVLLRDADGDDVADKQEEILRLETTDDYPHDGLAGIARTADGKLLLGLGENHGKAYRLVDRDGRSVSGKDGAGCVFECGEDGRGPHRVATGFWNPFSICALPDMRIFAIDNDPDASPPCRMVHVVQGGDYGFRFQYGRAGTHPLQAWNGELPGTMPYVCGVGEAPTAIVALGKWLWVTSWGDHCIDRYELVPRGASYGAKRETIVQGDADFRPTGMAVAPDGSLYFGDWVLKDYPVHGRGRIWHLVVPADAVKATFPARSQEDVAAESMAASESKTGAESNDPFVFASGVRGFSRDKDLTRWATETPDSTLDGERIRLAKLEAWRLRGTGPTEELLRKALRDKSADVRLFAVRWIADERITALRDELPPLLEGPQPSQRYYLAVLGAIDWLSHEPKMTGTEITDELLVRELKNEKRSAQVYALALRLISPDHKFLTSEKLGEYLKSDDKQLRMEAVRTLAQQSNDERFLLLLKIARDESQPADIRAEAIAGLSAAPDQYLHELVTLADDKQTEVKREARRALRLRVANANADDARPVATDIAAWSKLVAEPGDAASGRRLFFSSTGPRCGGCHKFEGRGGGVGPDLTQVGRNSTRDKILASILLPSQEIAPDYQAWMLTTEDGKVYTGLRLQQPGDDGKESYVDSAAHKFTLTSESIAERHMATTSVMPENLQSLMSIDDLRDLVTFLTAAASANK